MPSPENAAPARIQYSGLDLHGAKGLGDGLAGKRYRQPDHVRSHLTVADLRPRGDWLYHGDLGVNAHRATLNQRSVLLREA